ncbi:hypothetical protein D3C81_2066150 [compost metagenome]
MAQEYAELGNIATGRRVGGDDLEQATGLQVAHVLVQHHHRFRAVEARGVEHRIGGQGID